MIGDVPGARKSGRVAGLHSLAEEIRRSGGGPSRSIDVTRGDQIQALIATAVDQLGGIDALINNAGIASGAGSTPIVEMEAHRDRTVDVNLDGVAYLGVEGAAARAI